MTASSSCSIRTTRRSKGGTYPMTVKSICAQERAQNRLPASIWSIRAAPICPTRTRCSPTANTSAASSTTRRPCRAAGIPQIAVVMGSCTAGGAYVPAMSDESIIVATGHDLPRRPAAGEGRDRRGGERRGSGRRRRARGCRAWPITGRRERRHALGWRAGSSAT